VEISEITAISELGMKFESMRMKVASTNIAFANQVSGSPETVFKPMVLSSNLGEISASTSINFDQFVEQLKSRMVFDVTSEARVKPVHSPNNPLSDSAGFVYKPDVDMVTEMLTLSTATRAYEANIRAFNTYSSMSSKALEIGKR
jgi:flagellar basal-body rod protein FlgC